MIGTEMTGRSWIKSCLIKPTNLEDTNRKSFSTFYVRWQKPQIDLLLNCRVIPSLIPSLFHCKLAVFLQNLCTRQYKTGSVNTFFCELKVWKVCWDLGLFAWLLSKMSNIMLQNTYICYILVLENGKPPNLNTLFAEVAVAIIFARFTSIQICRSSPRTQSISNVISSSPQRERILLFCLDIIFLNCHTRHLLENFCKSIHCIADILLLSQYSLEGYWEGNRESFVFKRCQ